MIIIVAQTVHPLALIIEDSYWMAVKPLLSHGSWKLLSVYARPFVLQWQRKWHVLYYETVKVLLHDG
jgi:hypothetical protein